MEVTCRNFEADAQARTAAIVEQIKDNVVSQIRFLAWLAEIDYVSQVDAEEVVKRVGRLSGRVSDPAELKMFLFINAVDLAKRAHAEGYEEGRYDGASQACLWTQQEQEQWLYSQ